MVSGRRIWLLHFNCIDGIASVHPCPGGGTVGRMHPTEATWRQTALVDIIHGNLLQFCQPLVFYVIYGFSNIELGLP